MLSAKVKQEISKKIQIMLQSIDDNELPNGEINFLLHVDGAEDWSWANIRNNNRRDVPAPSSLICNETVNQLKIRRLT